MRTQNSHHDPGHASPSVALIGVGGFGAYHLRYLAALQERGLARLVSVADPYSERLQETHKRLRAGGVRWHHNYLDLLADEKNLDLVIIATPIPLHEEMTLAALEQTKAAIYLEKAPVPTLDQLRALISADSLERVHVGFQMVAWPSFRLLKRWICEGHLGRIQRITAGGVWPRGDSYYQRSDWAGRLISDTGEAIFDGPATNALAHLVHNIMFLAGPTDAGFARPVETRGEFYRARPIESYDAACLSGRFGTGIEYALAVAHCSRDNCDFVVSVQGDRGQASVTMGGRRIEADFCAPQEFEDPYSQEFHRETITRIHENRPPVNSLVDCLGYSEATCGGLMSSGAIHDVPDHFISHEEGEADRVYHVDGMAQAVEQTIATGLMWSEQGVAWAQSPAGLNVDGVSKQPFDLNKFKKTGVEMYASSL